MNKSVYLSSKPRYEILDGLCGVAAVLVVAYHILENYFGLGAAHPPRRAAPRRLAARPGRGVQAALGPVGPYPAVWPRRLAARMVCSTTLSTNMAMPA